MIYRNVLIGAGILLCFVAAGVGWIIASMSQVSVSQINSPIAAFTPTPRPTATATAVPATAAPIQIALPGATGVPTPTAALGATPVPTQTVTAAQSYVEYTVQKNDLLYGIALRYGVTVEDILAANQIADPNKLVVGQVLRIPRK